MTEITVVGVEDDGGIWRVNFSEPVYHENYTYTLGRNSFWFIRKGVAPDELAAYLWGLSVIQAHYARLAEEQLS